MNLSHALRETILSDWWKPILAAFIIICSFLLAAYFLENWFHNQWLARIGALIVGFGIIIDMLGMMLSIRGKIGRNEKITIYRFFKVSMIIVFFGTLLWTFGDMVSVYEGEISWKI